MVNFTVLDLFSGIGGFSLGLERAGMQTVAFCENDKFCQKVLAKHWPDIPIHENIEELDGRQYRGTVDLVCGGFPCQPFSVAGQQRGAEDDRALWPEMLRVIREVEPAWVIGENVSGIINMELDNVLSDLENSGYSCQTFVIPACAVDAPHRRDRVWIIASHANLKSKPDGSQHEGQRSGQLDVADTDSKRTIKSPGLDENAERQAKFRAESSGSSETVADTHDNDGRGRSGSQPRGRHSRVEHRGGGSGQPERETDSPVGNAKHDGSFATEITRSSSSSSDNDTKGQESSSKFEGASRPGNDETVADSKRKTGRRRRIQRPSKNSGEDEERPPKEFGRYGEAVAHPPSSRQSGQGKHEHPGNQEAHRERKTSHALDVSVRKEWGAQPGMGGMADGVSRWLDEPEGIPRVTGKAPDRVNRLKALGNAVVPQVVEVLGRFIIDKELPPG